MVAFPPETVYGAGASALSEEVIIIIIIIIIIIFVVVVACSKYFCGGSDLFVAVGSPHF